MFTNQLTYFLDKFHFILVVIARFFKILFRRKKEIEQLFLNYDTEHLFENSYIIINYRYRNALYYQFGACKTLEKHIKVFDIKNCDKEIDFVVHGLFRKKNYKLKFDPDLTLDNSRFKTSISNLNLILEEWSIPKLVHSNIQCDIKIPMLINKSLRVIQPNIKISNKTFNQNEFI